MVLTKVFVGLHMRDIPGAIYACLAAAVAGDVLQCSLDKRQANWPTAAAGSYPR